jgi:trans-aconitate methyltransferase
LDHPATEPKVIHQLAIDLVRRYRTSDHRRLIDAGCAAGELLTHFSRQLPELTLSGLEYSGKLCAQARKALPAVEFINASILDDPFSPGAYDIVTCTGVLSIFDDLELALRHLLKAVRPGGFAVIGNLVNPDDVDVIMRYRQVSEEALAPWQTGWNIFSMKTHEKIVAGIAPRAVFHWHDFRLPFSLPKQADPMRSWTIATEFDPYQSINGACQLVFMKYLVIQLPQEG